MFDSRFSFHELDTGNQGEPEVNQRKWAMRMVNAAEHWSQYSTCVRRQVGAVVFFPDTMALWGIGYNDTPIGDRDCGEGGCEECSKGGQSTTDLINCNCVHAEMNALLLSQRDTRGAWLAISSRKDGKRSEKPLCGNCLKHAKQAGIEVLCISEDGIEAKAYWLSDLHKDPDNRREIFSGRVGG